MIKSFCLSSNGKHKFSMVLMPWGWPQSTMAEQGWKRWICLVNLQKRKLKKEKILACTAHLVQCMQRIRSPPGSGPVTNSSCMHGLPNLWVVSMSPPQVLLLIGRLRLRPPADGSRRSTDLGFDRGAAVHDCPPHAEVRARTPSRGPAISPARLASS
jgi:hypothetical protein